MSNQSVPVPNAMGPPFLGGDNNALLVAIHKLCNRNLIILIGWGGAQLHGP